MKNEWNLKKQYKGLDAPELEKDIKKIERAYNAFDKKYRTSTKYLENSIMLKRAIEEYEKLIELPKPLSYLYLSKSIHTNNKMIDGKLATVQSRIVRAMNNVVFFRLSLGVISVDMQKKFLTDPKLEKYHYFLKTCFEYGKHSLSEKENQLLNELNLPAAEMWIDLTERLQGEKVIEHKGATIPLSEASGLLSNLKVKERQLLWKNIRNEFKKDASVAEAELNALYTTKAVLDRKRGFKEPFDETLLEFETTKKELKALREAVQENQDIAHEYFRYTRDVSKLKTLTYADRNIDFGTLKRQFSFDDSKLLLRELFKKSHPKFLEVLEDMLQGGRIDVFPRVGKTSGGFCAGNVGFPTFVLLNYVDTLESSSTFAHEMGHAIHTELAKSETPLYQGYSTAVAEFASTFFEELLFTSLLSSLTEKEKRILLHNRINRYVSTVFRQMAFFEFELALHSEVRSKGYVAKERIAELMNEKTQAYMGEAVTLDPDDGYFFVHLSHIRRHFYVYSYAYGGLLSRLVSKRVLDTPELFNGVVDLLSSGSVASPTDLFKKIGINTESKKTFSEALGIVRDDLLRLKSL